MMTKIIREFPAIKKPQETTSKQVLAWTQRVQAQRAQKGLTKATQENKRFNTMKTQD